MKNIELFIKAKNMYVGDNNLTMKEISETLGINSETLSKYLRREGIEIRRGFNPKIKLYDDGVKKYLNGQSVCSISKELGICRNRFSQYLKKQGIYVDVMRHKIKFNSDVFELIDTEEKAYWLGFLYADGSIDSRGRYGVELGLSYVDKNHIYKFREFLNTTHKISFRESKLGNSYRISVEDKKLYNDLIKQGCVPKKSLILTFPNENQVPKHLIKHFIRGYFDGDGCICLTDKTTSVNVLGTKEFLEVLKTCVDVLNCKKLYPIKYNSENKNTFRIQFESKHDIKRFLEYMYKDSNIYLDRKYEKYINFVCRPI